MKLSVALITYNEEENLPRFLGSAPDFAEEFVIVDSFSKDRTKEIALANPKVKFLEKKFEGFGIQKEAARQNCSGEWILFLDADEILDAEAVSDIQRIINSNPAEDVFKIKFINILFGKAMKYGGWANSYRDRLFRREKVSFNSDLVHESLNFSGKVGVLKGNVLHYTYKSVEHHMAKMNNYSSLMARRMYDAGKRTNYFQIYGKQFFQFFKSFVLQLGFLDGIWGYHAARTLSTYTFLKYMKLYELQTAK